MTSSWAALAVPAAGGAISLTSPAQDATSLHLYAISAYPLAPGQEPVEIASTSTPATALAIPASANGSTILVEVRINATPPVSFVLAVPNEQAPLIDAAYTVATRVGAVTTTAPALTALDIGVNPAATSGSGSGAPGGTGTGSGTGSGSGSGTGTGTGGTGGAGGTGGTEVPAQNAPLAELFTPGQAKVVNFYGADASRIYSYLLQPDQNDTFTFAVSSFFGQSFAQLYATVREQASGQVVANVAANAQVSLTLGAQAYTVDIYAQAGNNFNFIVYFEPPQRPYAGPDVPAQGATLRANLDDSGSITVETTAASSPQITSFSFTPTAGLYGISLAAGSEIADKLYASLRRSNDSSLVVSFGAVLSRGRQDAYQEVELDAISYDLDVYAEVSEGSFFYTPYLDSAS